VGDALGGETELGEHGVGVGAVRTPGEPDDGVVLRQPEQWSLHEHRAERPELGVVDDVVRVVDRRDSRLRLLEGLADLVAGRPADPPTDGLVELLGVAGTLDSAREPRLVDDVRAPVSA
jgi:hypothetical protein